jgi:hypothetical protein
MDLPKLDEHILMHKSNLNETTFKTLTKQPYPHKLIEATEVDLSPIANIKFYKVTIKRF